MDNPLLQCTFFIHSLLTPTTHRDGRARVTRGTRNTTNNDDDGGIDDESVRGDDDDDDDEETNGFEIVINHDSEKENDDVDAAGASDGRRGRGDRPGGD